MSQPPQPWPPPAPDGDPIYPQYPQYPSHPQYQQYQPGTWYPRPELRPGVITTAAVLGFVAAGLLLLAGIVLFTGASLVSSLDDVAGTGSFTAELALDGFLDLLAAGLLLAGAVLLLSRQPSGRAFYCVGATIVVVESVYWLVRWTGTTGSFALYAVLFAAVVVIGSLLACTRVAATWLAGQPVNAGNLNW